MVCVKVVSSLDVLFLVEAKNGPKIPLFLVKQSYLCHL